MSAIDPLLTFLRRVDARQILMPKDPQAFDAELHTTPAPTLEAVREAAYYLMGRIDIEKTYRCPVCESRLTYLTADQGKPTYCDTCDRETR